MLVPRSRGESDTNNRTKETLKFRSKSSAVAERNTRDDFLAELESFLRCPSSYKPRDRESVFLGIGKIFVGRCQRARVVRTEGKEGQSKKWVFYSRICCMLGR